MKKILKISLGVIAILILGFILSSNLKMFVGNCFGDICMGNDKLIYPLIRNESLCNFVGGLFRKEAGGWSKKTIISCEVIDPTVCVKNGGYIYVAGKDDPIVGGYCAEKK